MMDFEIVKVKGPAGAEYRMQARGKWYEVPPTLRHQNRTKLIIRFDRGEFKEAKV